MKYILLGLMIVNFAFGTAIDCNKKTHCSHFKSCAEAKEYLKKCGRYEDGGTQRTDGDNDGIPCERQFCNKGK
ncbi:excalibur calcium-binding domain-containing protein [Campylobacter rectus]|uniref:excalibur calcium-binding domain-containing protein n=1 Tax=Campylobacter rectus TaxID=203 RepID=UPI000F5D66A7|nr:excalibur calcium-binding domain-containing protein [Campylobacter rectus]RRD54120.1 cold-shock protein [Campylobacter rectus]